MKNFRQTKISVLRREFKEIGLSMSEARRLNKKDERILFVTGKLLAKYPVSFEIDFIFNQLKISLPTKSRHRIRTQAYSAYFNNVEKRA